MAEFDLQKFLISVLRRSFCKTPYYSQTLEWAKRYVRVGNRSRVQFQCASCGEWFFRKEVAVDHVQPVVNIEDGFVDWNTYIARMFTDDLQILCKGCHAAKSRDEAGQRKLARAAKKSKEGAGE